MLRFERITKSFGWRRIFRDIRGELAPGVYALQGPNGSGKSTLLGILSGAIAADAGEVWINGVSPPDGTVACASRVVLRP